MDNKKNDFKPYVPADKKAPEITVTSVVSGVLLAVIFGAANAYLGLKVGMTVSASIPSAVIAMGVIKVIMRKKSPLEANIIQTVGSSGESLAAGAVFTIPALFIWANEGITKKPSLPEITLIALVGGILGVCFMVPLRKTLIVKEHKTLPYPEGTACSQVILAGEKGGTGATKVFAGMGVSAAVKFIVDGLKLVSGEISYTFKTFGGTIGTQIYPAVMSVGYICGEKIAFVMFSGGLLSWMVLIPLAVSSGGSEIINIFDIGGAAAVWSEYIRYIGAGALVAGGFISLIKSLPLILSAFSEAVKGFKSKGKTANIRTEKELSLQFVIIAVIVLTLVIRLVDVIPVNFIGALIIVVFGFFFATVSARMVGLVGGSNNPVSGMTIATVLVATAFLKITGTVGAKGMVSAIAIASIVCIITAIAGDTSQDLKTGYLLGATPIKQQIGELIGVAFSALAIGGTLYVLNKAWGFGETGLEAPQATMMKIIVEGVMEGNLPWALILCGACIAIIAEILKIPVLPFAIGVYLPVQLNACIMIGGLVRMAFEKVKDGEKRKEEIIGNGILLSSGMIAGEGLMGIALATFTISGLERKINLSEQFNIISAFSDVGGLILFGITVFAFVRLSIGKRKSKRA